LAKGKDKIILPVDVDNMESAVKLVSSLKDEVGVFKLGLELFNTLGLEMFETARAVGAKKIFYDAKFHDIPNTVAGAVRAATRFAPWLITIHTTGGSAMMHAAREAAEEAAAKYGVERPKLMGVTILTSIDQQILANELRVAGELAEQVVHLAKLSVSSGMDGVIASPHEIELIRAVVPKDFLIITPGVRPAGADVGDQKRVMTPGEAVKKGADYLVIGRPIIKAPDPVAAARAIAKEIESVDL
jgi:orotidine-5'-phosphate decarboxylase